MARKKPAKRAAKKTSAKPARRKVAAKKAKTAVKKARKAVKKAVKTARSTAKKTAKTAGRLRAKAVKKATKVAKKATKQATKAATQARKAVVTAKAVQAGVKAALNPPKKPNLDRPRKTVADIHGVPSTLDNPSSRSGTRTGYEEMREKLHEHTSSSPALTAGDVDADWASADSTGDEAPGGDNPTPDQDVVDEIGRALGVEYDDAEELQGGDEIAERDHHRWEFDPASKDDFEED